MEKPVPKLCAFPCAKDDTWIRYGKSQYGDNLHKVFITHCIRWIDRKRGAGSRFNPGHGYGMRADPVLLLQLPCMREQGQDFNPVVKESEQAPPAPSVPPCPAAPAPG